MNYACKVFAITDLVRCIGDFKYEFELAHDIQQLNNMTAFQELVFRTFYCKCNTCMMIKHNNKMLNIKIFKNNNIN